MSRRNVIAVTVLLALVVCCGVTAAQVQVPDWNRIIKPLLDLWDTIISSITGFLSSIAKAITDAIYGALSSVGQVLISFIRVPLDAINTLAQGLNKLFRAIFGLGFVVYGLRRFTKNQNDRLSGVLSLIGIGLLLSLAAQIDTEAPYGIPKIGWLIGGLVIVGFGIVIAGIAGRFAIAGVLLRGLGFTLIVIGGVIPEYAIWIVFAGGAIIFIIAIYTVISYILAARG